MNGKQKAAEDEMMPLAHAGAGGIRQRLFWVFGAQSVAILLRIAQQIVLVPVLIRFWGASLYQDWILVFSAVGFLTMLDLGMQIYFGNAMLLAWSREDFRAYRRHFAIGMSLYAGVIAIAVAGLVAATAVFSWPALLGADVMGPAAVLWTGGVLATATLLLIPFGIVMAVYRAHGDYSRGTSIMIIGDAMRGFGICAVAIAGGTPALAAWVYLVIALLFWLGVISDQRRRYGEGFPGFAFPNTGEMREAALRSSLYLVPTVTSPVVMNAPILLLGTLGALPGAVVAYSVTRTFVGFVRQVVLQFAHPIGAELTRQHAAGEIAKARRLFFSAGRLLSATAGLLAGFALIAAAPFIRLWTHGEVAYDPWLIAAFVAPIIFMAPAFAAQMLYQYNNKPLILVFAQGSFTVGTVVLCVLLIGGFSAAGAAAATGLAECLSIGLLLPYAASREIAFPILPYFCRCHVAGGAALVTSAAVAWAVQHWLHAEGLLGLMALGLLWSALMAGPAFFLLLGAEERHWTLLEARSAWRRFSGGRIPVRH